MKSRSLFGVKSITNLLYGLIILLPMFAILGRVIYTQSNPNAKDSYTGNYSYLNTTNLYALLTSNTITTTSYEVNSTTNYYYENVVLQNTFYTDKLNATNRFRYNYGVNVTEITYNNESYYDKAVVFVGGDGNNVLKIQLYDFYIDTSYELRKHDHYYFDVYFQGIVQSPSLTISLTSSNNLNPILRYTAYDNRIYTGDLSSVNFSTYGKLYCDMYFTDTNLSSAFETAISQFTRGNNLGNIDLFGWFTDLFLNQSNPTNVLYIGFVNWYLNYTLLVSSGYLIFLALIWFINYVRKILDKSMYHDFGGF